MWLSDYSKEIEERLLRFLWRQWAQLGVQASGVNLKYERDGWVIDPEALLLFSTVIARRDPRLFDEVIDWLNTNAAFTNIPRLKSLARRFGLGDLRVMAAMADVVSQRNSRLSWRFNEPGAAGESESLFYGNDGQPMPDFGVHDETFLAHGFARGQVELRGMSSLFNKTMPECSLLRLRALFGVSARAEIMLYLLTHPTGYPSKIARETGFSQKNIQDTMVDLSASGFIFVGELEGRAKVYFMRQQNPPPFLHRPEKPPRWITWPPLFRALQLLTVELRTLAKMSMSDNLLASELVRISDDIRPVIEKAGFVDVISRSSSPSSHDSVRSFRDDINKLLAELRAA